MGDFAIAFDPFDTVAFREPRPFQQDDLGLAETIGVFPPYPPTLAGAALVALAGAPPAKPGEMWEHVAEELEQQPSQAQKNKAAFLRRLVESAPRMIGPLLVKTELRHTPFPPELYVPCPATFRVSPEPTPMETVQELLPAAAGHGVLDEYAQSVKWETRSPDQSLEPTRDHWIAWNDLKSLLAGNQVKFGKLLTPNDIVGREQRIALALDPVVGKAIDAQLYATDQRRLRTRRPTQGPLKGTSTRYLPAMIVQGIDPAATLAPVLPCGGEGRFAACAIVDFKPAHGATHPVFGEKVKASKAKTDGSGWLNYRIVALTPAPVDWTQRFGIVSPFGEDHDIVVAVAERPRAIGFFDPKAPKQRRSRIVHAFPAGSTWFVRAKVGKNKGQECFSRWAGEAPFRSLAPDDLSRLGFGGLAVGVLPQQ